MALASKAAVALGTAGVLVAGCNAILGFDGAEPATETISGGGMAGQGGTGGGGGSGCPAQQQCVPPADGAAYVLLTAEETCPAGWTNQEPLYDGVDPGCTECCCSDSLGGSCGAVVTRYSDGACGAVKDGPTNVADDQCMDVHESSSTQARSYRVSPAPVPGACAPAASDRIPLTWRSGCVLTNPPSTPCPTGQCVPSGAAGQLCVVTTAATCPPGFPQRSTAYTSYQDSRQCECSCGPETGGSCNGATWSLWEDPACSGTASMESLPAEGSCDDVHSFTAHDGYSVDAGTYVGGICQPQAQHTGAVQFDGSRILCCRTE